MNPAQIMETEDRQLLEQDSFELPDNEVHRAPAAVDASIVQLNNSNANMSGTQSRWLSLTKEQANTTLQNARLQSDRPMSGQSRESANVQALPSQSKTGDVGQPVEYEADKTWQNKITRLKTIAQTIDKSPVKNFTAKPPTTQIKVMAAPQDPDEATEAGDEDDLSFTNFRFQSFRTHKLIEEDYSLLQVDEPEEAPMINTKELMTEERLIKDGIELVAIDQKQLARKEKELRNREEAEDRRRRIQMRQDVAYVNRKKGETSKYLDVRQNELKKFLEKKQQRSKEEFVIKKTVLTDEFKDSVENLIDQIKHQKEIIIKSYGPLMLSHKRDEPPVFGIAKELDPIGHKWIQDLNRAQNRVPQSLLVKVRAVRCLKDKVSSGHYLVIVHALDRIGGNRIGFDEAKTEGYYKVISKNLREYAQKKIAFLNQDNRQVEEKRQDGTLHYRKAEATGINFFKADTENPHPRDDRSEQSNELSASSLDFNQHLLIDLERTYTRYTRFSGRASDENLEFDDTVTVLIPAKPQTTNVLLFQLILLESESIPKDYTVGWGVYPILNQDFAINEGRFKVPLLFGNVDPNLDRFELIEGKMMQNLDNWTANLYFEIERVQLMNLKIEAKTDRLFYKPVVGETTQELQQMVKYNAKENHEELLNQAVHMSNKRQLVDLDQLIGHGHDISDSSEDEDLAMEFDGSDEEDNLAEQVANLVYNNQKDSEEINYDHYQFSVSQKFDFSTRNLTFKKAKYIADEVFIDLKWGQRHTIQFKTTVLIIVFLFWFRIFTHYVGQYTILRIMEVPVTGYKPNWCRVQLEYAAWEFYQDVFVVAAGQLSNTIVFLFMYWSSIISNKCFGWYPKFWYKVICWQGIYAVADPPLTFFFDTVSQQWDSDYYKFYNYFLKSESSGLTGIYIILIVTISIMMFSGYCFYKYMVFTYMRGRILDLYRRLNATYKQFFLPHDNEVSLKYLQWVLERYRQKNCIIMSELRTLKDKYGIDRNINFIQIFGIKDDKIMKNRLFFKDFDGSIIEVPQKKVVLQIHELKKIRKEAGEGSAHIFGDNPRSLNSYVKSTFRTIKTNTKQELNGSMNMSMDMIDMDASLQPSGIEAMKKMQQKERAAANEEDSAKKPLLEPNDTVQEF